MKGTLKIKNGLFYAVINYKDSYGRYKQKWISTGLKERGNKKQATAILLQELDKFNEESSDQDTPTPNKNNISFMDYLDQFLETKKVTVEPSTYQGYRHYFKIMGNFFGKNLKLRDITHTILLEFYDYLRNERHLKNSSIKRYKEIIAPALRIAYRDNLIPKNPYEFMPKLKRENTKREFYDKDELETLFRITDDTDIGLVVRVAAYYGFRRSEISGLRWKSIDFIKKTITIENKVINIKKEIIASEVLKTYSSNRTLPLLSEIEERLLNRKQEIERNKLLLGKEYNQKYLDYVFVDNIGNLILPDHITHLFGDLLKKHNLKHIRFHDLRHSCASLLVANNVPMKNIQEWLGHSTYNLTADTYSHLLFESKKESANVISRVLSSNRNENNNLDEEILRLQELLAQKLDEKSKAYLKK